MFNSKSILFIFIAASLCMGQIVNPPASIPVPVSATNGGSGVNAPTANCILAAEATAPYNQICPNTINLVLMDNGPGADPSFRVLQEFIDINAPGFTIGSNALNIIAYIDCNPGVGLGSCGGITINDGAFDGQMLTIVCQASKISSIPWSFSGDFTNFSTIALGGVPAGSYDLGGTIVEAAQATCGAVLMYSNANGVWELINLYGGTAI